MWSLKRVAFVAVGCGFLALEAPGWLRSRAGLGPDPGLFVSRFRPFTPDFQVKDLAGKAVPSL